MQIRHAARFTVQLGLAVAIGAGLTGCRDRTLPSRETVRMGVQGNAICALPFVAAEHELFRRQNLDVKIIQFPSGKLALQALFAGEVDIATCADMPIMTHSFQRNDFAVFGTIAWTERGAWILARQDRGIATPDDLRGKSIATQRNSAVHFFLSAFLAKHDIDEGDVNLVFMKAVELPAAFAEGRIDAFCMRNPFIARAIDMHEGSVLEMFAPNVYRQTFNLVAFRDYLRDNADLCERVLRALAAAEDRLIRDDEGARRDVISQLGADRADETHADWDKFVFGLSLDQSMFVTLEDQARWAMARNPKLSGTMPNYLQFIDPAPLLAAKPAAVSIIR